MAYTVTTDTMRSLNVPNMEGTNYSNVSGTYYSDTINSLWTHPNPFVLQIGNHLFHKDRVPSTLRWNDQKRDKEALDNIRNWALRQSTGDYTAAYSRQAVPPQPGGSYVPCSTYSNKTIDTVTYQAPTAIYTKKSAQSTMYQQTVYSQAPTATAGPVLDTPHYKPYSPLALPQSPAGNCPGYSHGSAYGGYGYGVGVGAGYGYGGYGGYGLGGYGYGGPVPPQVAGTVALPPSAFPLSNVPASFPTPASL
jgi:hypothetical protein